MLLTLALASSWHTSYKQMSDWQTPKTRSLKLNHAYTHIPFKILTITSWGDSNSTQLKACFVEKPAYNSVHNTQLLCLLWKLLLRTSFKTSMHQESPLPCCSSDRWLCLRHTHSDSGQNNNPGKINNSKGNEKIYFSTKYKDACVIAISSQLNFLVHFYNNYPQHYFSITYLKKYYSEFHGPAGCL